MHIFPELSNDVKTLDLYIIEDELHSGFVNLTSEEQNRIAWV